MVKYPFRKLYTLLLATTPLWLSAQATELKLDDLSQFKSPTSNWVIAGDATSDYTKAMDIQLSSGKGVLVNKQSETAKGDLYTAWEHGDIDLELEFIMPKNSNSGIYLQGKYEIQLMDSWGVIKPKSSDCGAIYERWDDNRPNGQQGYMGIPPRQIALKAPGLWNKLKISFEAPRFKDGKKVKNARIVSIYLNNILVQQNIDLSGPTRGADAGEEKNTGPLRIQGDHGPVAFRNIKHLIYNATDKIYISNFTYAYYEQSFGDRLNIWDFKPKSTGKQDALSCEIVEIPDGFAITSNSKLEIKKEGNYTFEASFNGSLDLILNKKDTLIKSHDYHEAIRPNKSKMTYLKVGTYDLDINYWKNISWLSPSLGVFISGPGIKPQAIHNIGSYPPLSMPIPHIVSTELEPKVYRAFLDFEGKNISHTAFVGDPTRLNYAVNPENMSFVEFWRGDFLDMGPAWDERGGMPVRTLGPINSMRNTPSLAWLNDEKAAWPDSVTKDNFKFKGYYLDENGRPRFTYLYNNLIVNDKFTPVDNGKSLMRELKVEGKADTKNLYCLLAVSSAFKQQKDGSYLVGDREYILKLTDSNLKPQIRSANGKQEMIVPVSLANGTAKISYSLTW